MLNYIWLTLIVIGIAVALWTDVHDLSVNTFHNGEEFSAYIDFRSPPIPAFERSKKYACYLSVTSEHLGTKQEFESNREYIQKAEFIPNQPKSGVLRILLDDYSPVRWKEMMNTQGGSEFLTASVRWDSINNNEIRLPVKFWFDPVKFVKLKTVTNEGIVKYAKTAVELAIGLIGIMALWLGIMKIAEQAGLIAKLAKALRPIMTRLFPDVPADHPAMGAMIMNISANMLGLSNAATPLGLKAMDELN